MPTDIAQLGIAVNTGGVTAADAALDRLAKAALDATAAVNRMTAASVANAAGGGAAAQRIATLATAHNTLGAAAIKSTAALHGHTAGMQNARMGAMEFEHSIRSIIDGLGAGMSPMRLFAMEGSRLAQAYQMSGGAAGTMQMFGSIVSKVMNPTVMLTGAVVGLGAAGLYAFNAWETRLNALQASLNGLGRSTGLTLGGLNNLATQSAGGRTSSAMAAQAITAFSATGKILPRMMSQLTAPQPGQSEGLVQQYSQATGQGYSESVKKLAADFADPTRGAAELNKEFLLLGAGEMELITRMDMAGDRLGAQTKLLDDLRGRVQGAADVTTIWARGWDAVAASASKAVEAAGRFIDPTLEDKLSRAHAAAQPGSLGASFFNPFRASSPQGSAAGAVLTEQTLQEMVDRRANAAAMVGMKQAGPERSFDIYDVTRRANPDIAKLNNLVDQRNKLQNAMQTPGALEASGMTKNEAQESLDRLNAGIARFGTVAEIATQEAAASAAATAASTMTQRTAILALKSYSDVMRDAGGAALAAAESTARWNQALAETKRNVDDETRQTGYDSSLIYLHGNDRERQEIQNKSLEFKRNNVLDPLSMLDRSMTALDTGSSGYGEKTIPGYSDKTILNYSRNIAPKLQSPAFGNALWNNYLSTTTPAPSVLPAAGAPAPGWPRGAAGSRSWAAAAGAGGVPSLMPSPIPPMSNADQHSINLHAQLSNVDARTMADLYDREQKSIAASNEMLQAQIATWGKMPGAIAEATTAAKLLNEENAQNVVITQKVLAINAELATKAGAQAQDQANWSNITQTVGQVQDMGRSIASGAASDFASAWGAKPQNIVSQLSVKDQKAYYSGKMSGQDVKNRVMMNQVWDLTRQEMSKFGVGLIEKGIFGSGSGANATPGLLSPLFSAGGSALGGLFGMGGGAAAGGASGGSFAGLSSLLGGSGPNPFAFALGGVMTPSGPRKLPMFASGGTSSGAAIFGEGGPEAAVPLPDGRAIPVAFKKATFGGGAASMTQHNYSVKQGDINIAGNADDKVVTQMRAEMATANKAMMAQLNRNIGTTTAKWSQHFGNN